MIFSKAKSLRNGHMGQRGGRGRTAKVSEWTLLEVMFCVRQDTSFSGRLISSRRMILSRLA